MSEAARRGTPNQRPPKRIPPQNLVAEEALLGAMLLSSDVAAEALGAMRPEHFYRPAHQRVFEAMGDLYRRNEPIDAVTVQDALQGSEALTALGGLDGLLTLQINTPATSGAPRYAEIVRQQSTLRDVISAATEILEMGYSHPEDANKVVDAAEAVLHRVAQHSANESAVQVQDTLDAALTVLERRAEGGDGINGTPTGYIDLDALLSGLQPGSLYVIGARPAMGKTSLALGMAANAAVRHGRPALLFSLEMSVEELTLRLLCSEARVDVTTLRPGRDNGHDWGRIAKAVQNLGGAPMWIHPDTNVTTMGIRAQARRLKHKVGDLGLVVIDYLQLMSGRSNAENRQVEVAEISRGLKTLATELRVPVIALSQLSRNIESRHDKRPMLADLRESGAIEQDADVVMFLSREEVYNRNTPEDRAATAELAVAKNRNGPIGTIHLRWLKQFTRFDNISKPGSGHGL